MRAILAGLVVSVCACAATEPSLRAEQPMAAPAEAAPAVAPPPAPPPPPAERLAADTARTTVEGATFMAPADWSITVRGPATILEAPEGDSRIALVDVKAPDAAAALAAAWAAYRPDAAWALKVTTDAPDSDGWTDIHRYEYLTSPNEKRDVLARTRRAGEVWTVVIYDMTQAVGEKRASAVSLILGRLLPKGYSRESFAGKKAHPLDAARLAQLGAWVEKSMKELGVPGVALGLVQGGKTVFAGGFGARELGKKEKPDADTLFMIASNTKALTTLMLAKLVDEKKLTWETPVTSLLPSFKLGDPETTRQVKVRHLICACTGLPRQDLEWIFQFKGETPASAMATLATMQPTSKFGEMFQYSNPMAGAGGFVGGHVLFPKLELGAAYDAAMRTRVFEPLGMKATTFDYARALKGNHAFPHAPDIDGKSSRAIMEVNYAIIPLRPAGAAWSNIRDMLKYVSAELAEGTLPGGKRYIAREPLLERRAPQVSLGKDDTYGMGLMVNTKYGIPVVHHGGDMIGFHSDMIWLPEHGVGAVVLTNADPGWILRTAFRRKLLEVLFDGKPEADAEATAQAATFFQELAAERKLLTVPAEAAEAGKLARRYGSDALGEIAVAQSGAATTFDFGEWKSEVASRRNPDGTVSFFTTAPGMSGIEFVVGSGAKRTLITRDSQHEYVFTER
jgi:CubicO group peptidase (beta-lactamase class C family)